MGSVIHIDVPKEKIKLAEQTVLGSIIFDASTLYAVESIISHKDFANKNHELIFKAILSLQSDQVEINLVSVTECLHHNGNLDAAGGLGYLADLGDNVGSASQASHYAKMVKEASMARQYANICKLNQIEAEQATEGKMRLHEIFEKHEINLFNLSKEYYRSQDIDVMDGILTTEIKHMEDVVTNGKPKLRGVPTGMYDIDRIINGLNQSELIYLAARPGVGKTGLALNIANNCNVPVGFFSLEMSKSEIAKRQISFISGVDGWNVKSMRLSPEEWQLVKSAANTLQASQIFIDDKPALSIQELRSKARQLVAKHHVKFIIVDYIQIMKVSKGRSREQEISDISAQLKACAKELNIPVLALAQLNREVEKRDNSKPRLSDLRESGSLEQDADMVILLWPEGKESMTVNFSIAKNRNGRTGDGKLVYNKSTQKFYDCED